MTDFPTTRETLLRFLKTESDIDTANVNDSMDWDQLGLDSAEFVRLLVRIEGYYRIRISQVELADVETIGELLQLIDTKIFKPAMAA